MGPVAIESLPDKYVLNRHQGEVFNASLAWDLDEVRRWNDRYGLKISDEALSLFQEYLDTGDFVIFQSLVEHPQVPTAARFSGGCSVILQRGDIYYSNGREDLFLRSYFHNTTDDGGEYVNFGPQGALHISFPTETLWYPLRVTQLNREPTTVVLNLMTAEPIGAQQHHEAFDVQKTGSLQYGLNRFAAVQVTAQLPGGEDVADVDIRV